MNLAPCPTCQSEKRYRRKSNNEIICPDCSYRRVLAWKAKNPDRFRQLNRESARRRAHATNPKARARYKVMRADPVLWMRYLERKRNERKLSDADRKRQARRRAWLRAGDVTLQQLVALHISSNRQCHYCGVIVTPRFRTNDPRGFDHVIPLAKGGKHTISNMVVCCKPCNTAKGLKETQT